MSRPVDSAFSMILCSTDPDPLVYVDMVTEVPLLQRPGRQPNGNGFFVRRRGQQGSVCTASSQRKSFAFDGMDGARIEKP